MQKIIFTTNSAKHLDLGAKDTPVSRYRDGEIRVVLPKDVDGKNVVLVGSTAPPADNIVELLFLLDALVSGGAKSVTLVIPYFGYGKSDSDKSPGKGVSARTMVRLLESLGQKKVSFITIDVHSDSVMGFFNSPIKNIVSEHIFGNSFAGINDVVVASPDKGSRDRAIRLAKSLEAKGVVLMSKERISDESVAVVDVEGEVKGNNVLIVDDLVQSGSTIIEAAKKLSLMGAREIHLAITHMDYLSGGYTLLESERLISSIVTTNTIRPPSGLSGKFTIVDISHTLKNEILS